MYDRRYKKLKGRVADTINYCNSIEAARDVAPFAKDPDLISVRRNARVRAHFLF